MNNTRFIHRKEIDEQKWNELVDKASHSLPYAYTWYLDAVAENWDALLVGDYEIVMPLVWLRKLGFKCLYQPYYCQQLGFFSKKPISVELAQELIAETRAKFKYININLNPSAAGVDKLVPKKNLLLPLAGPYEQHQKNYSGSHRRNIAKAQKAGLSLSGNTSLKAFQTFYLQHVDREKENFKPKHEKIFKMFTEALISRNKGKIFTVIDKDEKVQAAVLAVFHQKRIITVISSSSAEGKKNGASHFLFDRLIQQYVGSGEMIDFEGSSVPSIARFYEGFGATEEVFYNWKRSFLKL